MKRTHPTDRSMLGPKDGFGSRISARSPEDNPHGRGCGCWLADCGEHARRCPRLSATAATATAAKLPGRLSSLSRMVGPSMKGQLSRPADSRSRRAVLVRCGVNRTLLKFTVLKHLAGAPQKKTGSGAPAAHGQRLTKGEEPLSGEAGVLRVRDLLGWGVCGESRSLADFGRAPTRVEHAPLAAILKLADTPATAPRSPRCSREYLRAGSARHLQLCCRIGLSE